MWKLDAGNPKTQTGQAKSLGILQGQEGGTLLLTKSKATISPRRAGFFSHVYIKNACTDENRKGQSKGA